MPHIVRKKTPTIDPERPIDSDNEHIVETKCTKGYDWLFTNEALLVHPSCIGEDVAKQLKHQVEKLCTQLVVDEKIYQMMIQDKEQGLSVHS
jgi:hypothetical protein